VGFEILITIVVSALLTFGSRFAIAVHNTTKAFLLSEIYESIHLLSLLQLFPFYKALFYTSISNKIGFIIPSISDHTTLYLLGSVLL
jgi:hypothetical protein